MIGLRSSCVGDVIYDTVENQAFYVDAFGHEETELSNYQIMRFDMFDPILKSLI